MVTTGSGAVRQAVDYRLSRLGCDLTAMNADFRKPETAAQRYFAAMTRAAEVGNAEPRDRDPGDPIIFMCQSAPAMRQEQPATRPAARHGPCRPRRPRSPRATGLPSPSDAETYA